MTDMDGTQRGITDDGASFDVEGFVGELIPPRRPRWRTALLVIAFAAVLVAIPFLHASGLVTPRLVVTIDQTHRDGTSGTAVFVVRNRGHADVDISSFSAPARGLTGQSATGVPRRVKPGGKARIVVTIAGVDCETASRGSAAHVRIGARAPLGLRATRSYAIEGFQPPDRGEEVLGTVDKTGWVNELLCAT